MNKFLADPPVLRPARVALALAVDMAREANSKTPGGKLAARFAERIPAAVRAVLLEESARDRLAFAIAVERARRAAIRLAALEQVLDLHDGSPIALAVPGFLGERGQALLVSESEIAACAATWSAYAAALARDARAERAAHLKFPDPPGIIPGALQRPCPGEQAATGMGLPAAADNKRADA